MDHLPTARHTGSLATLVAALAVTLLAGSVALHTQGRATSTSTGSTWKAARRRWSSPPSVTRC